MKSLSTPPFNEESEKIVLGSIISTGNLIELNTNDFYIEKHITIYKALKKLKTIDIITLVESLKNNLEEVGGRAYLANLIASHVGFKIKPAIEVLKETSHKRKIRETILQAEEKIAKNNYDINDLVENVYSQIKDNNLEDVKDDVVPFSELAELQKETFSERYNTQFSLFDNALEGGFKTGDLVIVSAPTGFGKTSFTQNLTFNFANQGLPCLWFSYEVLGLYLQKKFVDMGADENHLSFIPLKHTSGNLDWIEQKIIESKKKYYTKFVAIDHLGFLLPRRKQDNQNYSAYLGQICRDLKMIAMEQEVIIILPVHMRKTDNPKINDIRDSSGIAQEADAVFTIKREENNDETAQSEYTNHSLITLAKNRATGQNVKGWFEMRNNLFEHDFHYQPLEKLITKRF